MITGPEQVIENLSAAFHGTLEENEQSFWDFHTTWPQDVVQSGISGSGRRVFALAHETVGRKDDRRTGNLSQ